MSTLPSTALKRFDLLLLRGARARLGGTPAVPVARGLSHFGEHGLGWLALGGAGWVLARDRGDWPRSMAAIVAAHATGVVVKRLVRRPRPSLDDVPPLVGTAGRLSFPSAHCCSTAAAAVVFAPVFGRPLMAGALVAMSVSRVLLGVHYPTDVLAGAAVGGAVAAGFGIAGPRAPRAVPS